MKLSAKKIKQKTEYLYPVYFDKVDSTNVIARSFAENGVKEGTTIIACEQTAGKGRLGRNFLSKMGGVYFSVVLKPEILPQETLFITTAAAVAVSQAIEAVSGKKCQIKWVNDIYINNKKVCGILTEGAFEKKNCLKYAILGIGINLFEPKGGFPENLPLAGSVFCKKDKILLKRAKKEQIIAEFANVFFEFYKNLQNKDFMKEYQNRSFLTGKEITYKKDGNVYNATVVGIDDNAGLIVKRDGLTETLSHGEIQIVGMEQFAV